MNNTLNPCKCDSGTGTGGDASDVVYDGATVDCIPVSVGQNLATVIKNLGDYVCGLDGRTQVVTVNTGAPSGGGEGDIWFRQQGSSITVYQRISGSWAPIGDLVTSGAFLQNVTVSDDTPTGGNPGDIHFKNVEGGTEVWYNNAGTWGSVGSIPTGGGSAPDLQAVTDEGNSTTNDINTSGTMQANAFNGVNATLTGVAQTNDLEISGTATWPSSPTDPAHLANKAYVDQSISGASPTYTQDQDVPNTGALSYLNSEYPGASAGDQVYKVASGMRRTWTCYALGEWSRIDEVIEE